MHFFTSALLFGVAGLAQIATAAYSVQDDYSGNNFFGMFTFNTEDDPTHGYVNYLDASDAQTANLTSVENGIVTIRSDSSSIASGRGRDSVRLTSKTQYTHGLVVLDLQHMPGSACGVWPAFWMTGPSWPNDGEIDIIEGVNFQAQNAVTMHTSGGCTMINENCQGNAGCSIQTGGGTSFGDGFNANGGGVYAMQWTSDAISVWFFPRNAVPADALAAVPDPAGWGNPTSAFVGGSGCTIDEHFSSNNIVFDTTFCAATCADYVQNNPEAFAEAYWTINSLKVYTASAAEAAVVAPSPTPSPVSVPPKPVSSAPVTPQPTSPPVVAAPGPTTTTTSPAVWFTPMGIEEAADGDVYLERPPAKRAVEVLGEREEKRVRRGSMGRYLRRHRLGGIGHSH